MAETDLKKLERPIKAFANKRRLAMVKYIKRRREASVGDIAEAIPLSIKATSKHLGILVAADVLEREQRNIQVFYTIARDLPGVAKMLITLL